MARPVGGPEAVPELTAETDPIERREHLRLVVEAVGSLPERQREALVMRELEGRSYAEIESRLRTSNGAVRQLLNRARAGVRARLGTLAGIEPALRWCVGTGGAGSNAARIGALTGGCAVTVKLCASALIPATLGTGALAPAPTRHVVVQDHQIRKSVAAVRPTAAVAAAGAATVEPRVLSYRSPARTIAAGSHWPATGSRTPARSHTPTGGQRSLAWQDSRGQRPPYERTNQPDGPGSATPDGGLNSDSRPAQGMQGPSAPAEGPSSGSP